MTTISFSQLNWFDNVNDRPHPWPGLNWLTAMLVVADVKKAMNFYAEVFGIVPIFELPDEAGQVVFARMRYRGTNFTLNQEGAFNFDGKSPVETNTTPPFIFYIYVDDVEKIYTKALQKGCKSMEEPHIEFWGDKKARLRDPFGYIWDIAFKVGE
ncbi:MULTISPECIES: VOC family protein [Legionella]|uniref:VOC family protein n=1 Tax=Legionella resiliens TaxID=2905958 RepID=A0ABS8X3F7_9GAMM|nr:MULTISPECIES: VOC family protein [unclassified Legionella]MCE0722489.1 VOC family protein [Legionella sp. 9fVS26]MCE3531643.1 VOC family protein [Legionella sp. 8cVS16]QLZ67663.1 VOC family protein [Legionella sp. PC1000]